MQTISVTTDGFACYTATMKKLIYLGVAVGGIAGGWLGSLADHGNWLGVWGIVGTMIGSLAGIWAAVKLGSD